jgi:hypothetical protein
MNDANRNFPFFRITEFGGKVASDKHAYLFHDLASYENAIRSEIPSIDPVTLLYLNEAMQAFKSGCLLASTVMFGVATEHTFLLLVEKIDRNPSHAPTFANVATELLYLTCIGYAPRRS